MRRCVERAEQYIPEIIRSFLGRLGRQDNPLSRRYTYTQITRACDQALARPRIRNSSNPPTFRNALGRNETYEEAYSQLNQADSPASIAAAVIIGLARAGNLQPSDVDVLRRTNYLLRAVPHKWYQRFCDAIDKSIRSTALMEESSRPDFASFRQLASLATLSFNTLRTTSGWLTRYQPYVGLDGHIISSREDFMRSLGGGGQGTACIKFAVDLGVLTTQPEKLPLDEKEWCRKNMHLNRIAGNPILYERLEKFRGIVSI